MRLTDGTVSQTRTSSNLIDANLPLEVRGARRVRRADALDSKFPIPIPFATE